VTRTSSYQHDDAPMVVRDAASATATLEPLDGELHPAARDRPADVENGLRGEWTVVTGGTKGIGRAIADRFRAAGANVVVVSRTRADLDAAVDDLSSRASEHQRVLAMQADITDPTSLEALFDELRQTVPRLDHFIANAGTGHVTPFVELSSTEIDQVVGLNLTGTIRSMQFAARMMLEKPVRNSCIVVVSSIRALGVRPHRLIYSATKAGINQAARVAARELAPYQVRVNVISPGITETPLTASNPEVFAEALRSVPMGRAAQPIDIAEAVHFLCSPAARFITGANLVVDGGESLQ
jgi:glucose 1-dehydrogenase